MKKKVLITGGSGFIGKYLTQLLIEKGYLVSILSRYKKEDTANISYYRWDVENQTIDEQSVLEADVIINLAGENIAEKRWTKERKQSIVQSRVQSIQLIYDVLKKYNKKLEVFVSASGVGIYGAKNSIKICSEESPVADDFLGMTCQKWESAADLVGSLKIRTVKIRTGLVIGPDDGFLKKMIPIFKLKIGTSLGTGEQYMPWIHIEDLCNIYIKAIENQEMTGAYNAVVRDGTTNAIFSKKLAKIYGYSMWLPNVPEFVIRLVFGEMSQIVLTGQRVSPDKILKTGFVFQFTKLGYSLRDCLKKAEAQNS
jgi:uncharacterized protein (TIGR01777 family)